MGINSSSIFYGVKDVRIAESTPYLDQYNAVLTSANSIGFKGSTKVKKNLEPIKKSKCANGRIFEVTIGYRKEDIIVETSVKEFTPSNMGMVLGRGDDITTNQTLIAQEFPLTLNSISNFRIEIVCMYVNKTNYATYIIPTAELTSDADFSFSDDTYLSVPLTFMSVPLNNVTWKSTPIGRMFIS